MPLFDPIFSKFLALINFDCWESKCEFSYSFNKLYIAFVSVLKSNKKVYEGTRLVWVFCLTKLPVTQFVCSNFTILRTILLLSTSVLLFLKKIELDTPNNLFVKYKGRIELVPFQIDQTSQTGS